MGNPLLEEMMQDRRAFERYAAKYNFQARFIKDDIVVGAALNDVSAGGLSFRTKPCALTDNEVSLIFEDSLSKERVFLRGHIVWTKSSVPNLWNVGIEFKNVPFLKISKLFKFVGIAL